MSPSYSFVLETDNLESTSEVDLATESVLSWMASVRKYEATNGPIDREVIVVSGDRSENFPTLLNPLHDEFPGRVQVEVRPGLNYYGKKAAGALIARNDYVVFVDSDVIYRDSWFTDLATTINEVHPNILYGKTFARLGTRQENTVAMLWQFPTSHPWDPRRQTHQHRWSNNWAVKKSFLEDHPIPQVAGDLKASGVLFDFLAEQKGVEIVSCEASAEHRQPTNLREWWKTSLHLGQSRVVQKRFSRHSLRWLLSPELSGQEFRNQWGLLNSARQRSELPVSLPFGLLFAITRYLAIAIGVIGESAKPLRKVTVSLAL